MSSDYLVDNFISRSKALPLITNSRHPPAVEIPSTKTRASGTAPDASVFCSCPKDYGSYEVSRLKCCRCVQLIWVLISSQISSYLKILSFLIFNIELKSLFLRVVCPCYNLCRRSQRVGIFRVANVTFAFKAESQTRFAIVQLPHIFPSTQKYVLLWHAWFENLQD